MIQMDNCASCLLIKLHLSLANLNRVRELVLEVLILGFLAYDYIEKMAEEVADLVVEASLAVVVMASDWMGMSSRTL